MFKDTQAFHASVRPAWRRLRSSRTPVAVAWVSAIRWISAFSSLFPAWASRCGALFEYQTACRGGAASYARRPSSGTGRWRPSLRGSLRDRQGPEADDRQQRRRDGVYRRVHLTVRSRSPLCGGADGVAVPIEAAYVMNTAVPEPDIVNDFLAQPPRPRPHTLDRQHFHAGPWGRDLRWPWPPENQGSSGKSSSQSSAWSLRKQAIDARCRAARRGLGGIVDHLGGRALAARRPGNRPTPTIGLRPGLSLRCPTRRVPRGLSKRPTTRRWRRQRPGLSIRRSSP